jgi:iron complex transport system permease protein
MTTATDATTVAPPRVTRAVGITIAAAALFGVALLSLAVGAKSIPLATVIDSLLHPSDTQDAVILTDLRVPRTILGLLVGAALGLAGALMQGLTRNPLADPGLLGVNAGAAAGVIVAIALLGLGGVTAYVWFAFAGAAGASVVVYVLGTAGRAGATPVRLALAGTAMTAALTAFTYAVALGDPEMLQRFQQWAVGSIAGRETSTLVRVAPFLGLGIVLALALSRALNALALGDDAAR